MRDKRTPKDVCGEANKRPGAFSRLKCGRKLDAANNYCFNYGVIIFRIKLTELTSFNLDYIAAALIRGGALVRVNMPWFPSVSHASLLLKAVSFKFRLICLHTDCIM